MLGGREKKGENGWRRVEFIENETDSAHGCSTSVFALASTNQTIDLSNPNHVR